MAKAWELKDSMLLKDRGQASPRSGGSSAGYNPMRVIDDQADYFGGRSADETSSAWVTDDERAAAMAREEERQNALLRRPKVQLKFA